MGFGGESSNSTVTIRRCRIWSMKQDLNWRPSPPDPRRGSIPPFRLPDNESKSPVESECRWLDADLMNSFSVFGVRITSCLSAFHLGSNFTQVCFTWTKIMSVVTRTTVGPRSKSGDRIFHVLNANTRRLITRAATDALTPRPTFSAGSSDSRRSSSEPTL